VSDVESLRRALADGRADLLTALEGVTQEEFIRRPPGEPTDADARWPVRDVLWHVGMFEDWVRRGVDAARRGVEATAYEPRRRPAHVSTPALLLEWLAQTRRPTLVLLGKLRDEELGVAHRVGGRERTFARGLAHLGEHDREHARQVRQLRALASGAAS